MGDERIQVKNGVIMNLADDEADAIDQIRRFLSYLPANVWESPPIAESDDDPERREESLIAAVPRNRRRIYDPPADTRRRSRHGQLLRDRSPTTGVHGSRVSPASTAIPWASWANHPKYNGGSMDIAAGEKTIRLIELCDTFHLPLVYFADEPGFSVGRAQEELGIVRAGARVVTAHTQSKTPFICFVVRQLYGVAGGLHQRGGNALYRRYCWPSTHGGSMHIEGGTAIAYKRDIENAPDPEARRQEIEARLQAISSPFRNAHAFGIEEIIDPRDTRPLLVDFIDDAWKVAGTQVGTRERGRRTGLDRC